jgi:methyl-accepting chemotaxis protein
MSFRNLRIATKLVVGLSGLIALFSLASALIFASLWMTHAAGDRRGHARALTVAVAEVHAAMAERVSAFRGYLLTGDSRFTDDLATRQARLDKAQVDLESAAGTPADHALAVELGARSVAFRAAAIEPGLRLMADPATRAQASGVLKVGAPIYRSAQRSLDQLAAAADAALKTAAEADASTFLIANLTFLVSGAIASAAAFGVGFILWKSIAVPVAAMTRAMRQLAEGDLEAAIPAADRRDEVGDMAKSVEVFRDTALAQRLAEARGEDERVRAEAQRREAEEAAIAAQQALVVGSIGQGLRALADGKLTHRLTTPLPPAYEGLRADFNAATDSLQQALDAVSAGADAVRTGANEIRHAAGDLSQRTEQQASALDQTAASLDAITATVKRTADGARQASQAVESARVDAQSSASVMGEARQAMGAIESSANQISLIVSVIDEIAFQTNLLALNAGVEAARAGDSGKGFAVVAQEVRALAQRSADAAKEIKALIATSHGHVEKGVDLVGRTGQALETILSKVAEFAGLVGEIAVSAQAQAVGLTQVNAAVGQMDHATQQNAAMVEQTTAASASLAKEADQLGRLIGRFEVGGTTADRGPGKRRAA